jgi:hypothetical protein
MSASRTLQIQPPGEHATLSPDQQKFNTLIRQIEQSRASLQAWKDATFQYTQTFSRVIVPLEDELRATRRAWVLAMDAASLGKGWTKGERAIWDDLVSEAARSLLMTMPADQSDPELKALYERHAQVDFEEERLEDLRLMKVVTEAMSGVDLGDVEGMANEEELFDRLSEKVREKAAASADQDTQQRPPRHGKTAAQKRRESEKHEASLSVRAVYRKLASVLHPDRETDAAVRAAKTELMQQANQAYAKEDLLTLLELQLRAEQIDIGSMANLDAGRLKHYVKVLKDQAGELKREIEGIQFDFCTAFGLQFRPGLKPDKLGQIVHGQAQGLRAAVAQLKQEMRRLDDPAATKRWLKAERQRMREGDFGGDEFY